MASVLPLAGCATDPGYADEQPTLRIVGIGDSIMAGTNCNCSGPMDAYAAIMVSANPEERTETTNLGVPGWTSADVLASVNDDPDTQAALASADIVVVIAGANDLGDARTAWYDDPDDPTTLDASLQALSTDLPQLLDRVRALRGHQPTTYLVAGYWNVYPEEPDPEDDAPYTAWTRSATAAANRIIEVTAVDHDMTYVDLASAFASVTGSKPITLLADDGEHPNAKGVALIAATLAAATPG